MASCLHQERFRLDIRENFFTEWLCSVETGCSGDGAVPIPGGAQEMTACGTLCYGLVEKLMFSPRLNLMILEFFSSLTDSMITIAEFPRFS